MTQEIKGSQEIKETEVKQVASEISAKINLLTDFSGESLKGEMASLKKALLENPAAAALLLPEDIGKAVAAIRRMVGIAIASANAPKEKKPAKSKQLTAVELAKAMASVSDDDF